MFTTSEWERDVPKGIISFGKKAVKTRESKPNITTKNKVEEAPKRLKTRKTKIHKNRIRKSVSLPVNKQSDFVKQIRLTKLPASKQVNKNYEEAGKFVRSPVTNEPDSGAKINQVNKKVALNSEKEISKHTKENALKSLRKQQPQDKTKSKKKKLKRQSHNDPLEPSNLVQVKTEAKIKKKSLNESFKNKDKNDTLTTEQNNTKEGKLNNNGVHKLTKKDKLKKILSDGMARNQIKTNGGKLRQRMLEKLKTAQFRYLNEKLYTSSGTESQELFKSDPLAFQTYHQGYQMQVKKWPVNPLDIVVNKIQKLPKTSVVADMGCGEAMLSRRVQCAVRSFDLVSCAPGVEQCDMARTPLLARSVDAAVYCLALMGTDLTQYLLEANRVLKLGGLLLVAEVESRFDDADQFARDVQRLGFKLITLDNTNQVFYFLEFKKVGDPPVKKSKLPHLTLKPCLYKRR